MSTPADRARWSAAMEEIGRAGVASRLSYTSALPDAPVILIGDHDPWPTRADVEQWLAEQGVEVAQRKEQRYKTIRFWTIGAAIACMIVTAICIVAVWSR